MHVTAIAEARRFSLERPEVRTLVDTPDLKSELLCFEAGQRLEPVAAAHTITYLVLEGEALVRADAVQLRLGQGKLLRVDAGERYLLENAGGGLLVVLASTPA
ncbi:MAG: hypothetical protein RIS86_713 [Planctomycetota bacterium]|jgi:quercetin dioxygenase-like cupin family protein